MNYIVIDILKPNFAISCNITENSQTLELFEKLTPTHLINIYSLTNVASFFNTYVDVTCLHNDILYIFCEYVRKISFPKVCLSLALF